MSNKTSIKRAPLGEIGNTLVTQSQNKQCAKPRQTEQQSTKSGRLREFQSRVLEFYSDCHRILNQNQADVQLLLTKLESNQNQYLIQQLSTKQKVIQQIKQHLSINLNTLSEYCFIDKKQFRTKRATGEIELIFSSNETLTSTSQQKYQDLDKIKGVKINNTILTQAQITEITKTLPHLQQLNLYQCAIDDEGAKIIASNLPSLTNLQLEWNLIGDDGTMQIARKLKKLRNLNLYLNNVGDSGAQFLVHNLRMLKTLNIDNNEVGAEALDYVASHLKSRNS